MSVYHRPGRRHDVFLPFFPFSALTCSFIMMDSFEYASLIFNSLFDPSHPLSPQPGLLHPRRSTLMGRPLSPRLTRSRRCVRLDHIPHIRARNRQSAPTPPFSLTLTIQFIISAPTLRVAGSTFQTCMSYLPILRQHTSSLCPSFLMSQSTTLR